MPQRSLQLFSLLPFLPLLYLRIRRGIGFRRFGGKRLLIPITVFGVILTLVFTTVWLHPAWSPRLGALIGAGSGLVLAVIAMRLTVFEWRDQGLFFRTDLRIQIAVLVLFVMRIGYRIAGFGDAASNGYAFGVADPWTAAAACLLFGYNLAYFGYAYRVGARLVLQGRTGSK